MENNYFDKNAKDWDKEKYRSDRAKIIANKIMEIVPVSKQYKILDFGCGTGLLGFNFIDISMNVCFADTSKGMINQIKEKANIKGINNYKVINLEEELITEQYNLIISLMTLHHIDDYNKSINELSNNVVSSGYISFCDLLPEDGTFHSDGIVPHNGIDPNNIVSILENNNFQIISNTIPYIDKKNKNGNEKEYPLFLIIAKKN